MKEEGVRRVLHEAIGSTNGEEDEVQGAVLVGWVVVAEWMDEDGRFWLTKQSGDAAGEKGVATWKEGGYLHEALFRWPDEKDDGL